MSGPSGERCENCYYAQEATQEEKDIHYHNAGIVLFGQCRIRGPFGKQMYDAWPVVRTDDWCGEFMPSGSQSSDSGGDGVNAGLDRVEADVERPGSGGPRVE